MQCKNGYKIITNPNNGQKDACCKSNEFAIFNNDDTISCQSSVKINSSCLSWDRKNLKCTRCKSPTYLVSGMCCNEGTYTSAVLETCENITAIDDCVRYNVVDGCTKCNTNFILNKSKSKV